MIFIKISLINYAKPSAMLVRINKAMPIWETHTPYFEKNNIHSYVNRLGLHIVEFYNHHHKDPHQNGKPDGRMPEGVGEKFFRFEKVIK